MHPTTQFAIAMDAAEVRLHEELASEITHPLDQYQPGSERLERLYEAMSLAQRFQQPSIFEFNL